MNLKEKKLNHIDFCAEQREKAIKEYGKYNGFASQVYKTQRETGYNMYQMAAMAEFTQKTVEFWDKEFDKAIEQYKELEAK
jgi:hypothetical protein